MNAHAKSTFGFSKLKDSKAMHDFATSTTYTCIYNVYMHSDSSSWLEIKTNLVSRCIQSRL